jgi:uncharacterized protein YkwD
MAMGAVAVASGLLPGPGYLLGKAGDVGGGLRADAPPSPYPHSVPSSAPADRDAASASRGAERTQSPTAKPSTASAKPSATPSTRTSQTPDGAGGGATSSRTAAPAPAKRAPSATPPDAETAAESEVLRLVNQERSRVGCSPVTADPELARLAEDFSEDMAQRDFFGHTDPDGASPWDRAAAAGITDLGGENIARGQADARSVMDAWMDSPGHRANILNCDYTTLGVGAHLAEGGPWWTQDFGF